MCIYLQAEHPRTYLLKAVWIAEPCLRVVLGPGELYVNRNETCTMNHYTILARVVCVPPSREALTV